MTYWYALLFSGLTVGAMWLTYNDVGMQDTTYKTTQQSVRSGSYFAAGGGGYRYGK